MTWLDYWKNIIEAIKLLVYESILIRLNKLSTKRLIIINKLDTRALKLLRLLRKWNLMRLYRWIAKDYIRRYERFDKVVNKYLNRNYKRRSINKRLNEIADEQESFLWINYGIRL